MHVPSLAAFSLAAALTGLTACKPVSPDALPATQTWLALVDNAQYADSWTEAASFFKGKVDSPTWEKSVVAARARVGQKVESRVLKSSVATSHMPGAPDGDYVVFIFQTKFDQKNAVERVTPMLDTDGRWRVSGYYVDPEP